MDSSLKKTKQASKPFHKRMQKKIFRLTGRKVARTESPPEPLLSEKTPTPVKKKKKRPYQDFAGKGEASSRSHDKLKALRLNTLPGANNNASPLEGFSVLDLGCNEGFFCLEAIRQGATRVVGIDAHGPSIESASKNVPEAEFVHGSWWDVPDDQFDVILLLSAIHYEKNQKKFLEMLLEHLSPKGTLILECGIANEQPNIRRWDTVKRHDGIKKYPTRALLTQDILERFAVRSAGRSVDQAGDPVPRYVFHCTRRQSTALLIPGLSGIGKSQLGTHFANLGTPVYATDSLILRLSKNPNYSWRPLAKAVQDIVVEKGQDWGAVGEKIASDDELGREAVDIIIEEIPKEVPLFIIEGDLLRHEFIISELISRIKTDGIRPWLVSSC